MLPAPMAGFVGTYPIPRIINFKHLGFPQGSIRAEAIDLFTKVGRQQEIQWRYRFVPEKNKWDVYPVTAFETLRRMQFGANAQSPEWIAIHGVLSESFFPGVNFLGSAGRVAPIEVQLREKNPFPDGDTASVKKWKVDDGWVEAHTDALIDGGWVAYSSSVRMDGVDSAESYRRSEKFERNVVAITSYFQMKYAVPEKEREALKALVAARMVYLGKIAGTVTHAFGEHFADIGIRLGPAYTLLGKERGVSDTLDLWDKYGRIIGRILAGRDNDGEDLLAGFMEAVLPRYMQTVARDVHLKAYREEVEPYAEVLEGWNKKRGKPELFEMLNPKSAPMPTRIFSRPTSRKLARLWTDFVIAHPEAKNDLQTLSALIGTAPPYPKYPGHMAMTDLLAEQIALGAMPGISKGHGLTGDPISQLLRPSAHPDDPYRSLAYSNPLIGLYMSGITDIGELDPLNLHGRILRGEG